MLDAWAAQWGIHPDAVNDLRARFGMIDALPRGVRAESSEAALQAKVRLAAARKGIRLFRNNVGAGKLEDGSFVRWGICNDSAALNGKVKSSDLIGIRPDGIFIARECKAPGWKYRGTERERAQLHFIELIAGMGGDARFTTSETGDL